MSRVVYVNGGYVPWSEAAVHAEDRGFQFADAVYEVCEVSGGRLVDEARHIERLDRSLGELHMAMPMSAAALGRVIRETVRRNRVRDGSVYLQVTRGARPRDFLFPGKDVPQTVVCIARPISIAKNDAQAAEGIRVKTLPEMRWQRCDIKTVMLLPSSLAKEAARAEGAKEAWFIDADGRVLEGASSNAWIVDANGRLMTRHIDNGILRGITRTVVVDLAAREKLALIEGPFTVEQAKNACEAFVTSATNTVMPVVEIDGVAIGNGKPGKFALQLRELFHTAAKFTA